MVFWLFIALCLTLEIGSRDVEGAHIGTGELVALGVLTLGWFRVVGDGSTALATWFRREWQANQWIVLYAAWVIVASVANVVIWGRGTPLRSLRELLPAFTIYATMTLSDTGGRSRSLFKYGIFVVILGSALLATIQYSLGIGYLNPVNPDAWFKHKLDGYSLITHPVVGFMAHPNGLGLVLAPCLCIAGGALAMRLRSKRLDSESVAYALVIAAGIAALWLSQAKMAIFIGLCCMAAAFLGSWSGRQFSARWGIVTLATTCIAGAVGLWAAANLLSAAGGVEMGTLWYRLFLVRESVEVIGHSTPAAILGGGLDIYRRVRPGDLTVHNEFLNQWLKFGVIGAFLFGAALIRAVRSAQSSEWGAGAGLVALTALLLVESANGVQALTIVYGLLAFAAVNGWERSTAVGA